MINLFKKSESKKLGYPKRIWNRNELSEQEREIYHNPNCQIEGKDFIEILESRFTPFMKSNGFRGTKNNFYKKDSPWIFTMQIFKDKWGGSCAINNGVHLDFVETVIGKLPIPSKFRTTDCILDNTNKIHLDNGNPWLYYGQNHEEAFETVEFMIEMVQKKVFPFFEKFNNFPEPFSLITLQQILNPTDEFSEYGIDKNILEWVHFKIFLSRVNYHVGNVSLAIDILESATKDEFYTSRRSDNEVVQLINQLLKTYN